MFCTWNQCFKFRETLVEAGEELINQLVSNFAWFLLSGIWALNSFNTNYAKMQYSIAKIFLLFSFIPIFKS